MKNSETELSKKPSFKYRRENRRPRENQQKKACTGNQMHISAGTENQTQDSLVQSEIRYATLARFPFHTSQWKNIVFLSVEEFGVPKLTQKN